MIYLDHASTSPVSGAYNQGECSYWMNPHSFYSLDSKNKLSECENCVRQALGVVGGYIIFTFGASHAFNVLKNTQKKKLTIVASPWEHESVYNFADYRYDEEDKNTINRIFDPANPVLYCQQGVNPITGEYFNIEGIKNNILQSYQQMMGVDITAAVGKTYLPELKVDSADALWFSGHKFGALPGLGCLWISDKLAKFYPVTASYLNGHGLVHGTPNVQGIYHMCARLLKVCSEEHIRKANYNTVLLQNTLIKVLKNNGIEYELYDIANSSTAIQALTLPGINADALCQFLASKEIYVAPGQSACAKDKNYRVLQNFDYSKKDAEQTIRISFNAETTQAYEIIKLVETIKEFKDTYVL